MKYFVCALCLMSSVTPTVACAQQAAAADPAKIRPQAVAGDEPMVAKMIRTRIDLSWLFEPVLADRILPSPQDAAKSVEMVGLARFAIASRLNERPDVRIAIAAVGKIVLAEAARRSLIDSILVTDADVLARIAQGGGRYDEYNLSHIFVAVGTLKNGVVRSDADALERARTLRRRIGSGTAFAVVARDASEDVDTAEQGGLLPEMKGVGMNPIFFKHVQALPAEAVTEPVRGPDGYHLIRINERKSATSASARFWVEQDVIGEKLPKLMADAVSGLVGSKDER